MKTTTFILLFCFIFWSCGGLWKTRVDYSINPEEVEKSSCENLIQQLQTSKEECAKRERFLENKTKINVAWMILGLFIWPFWAAVDISSIADDNYKNCIGKDQQLYLITVQKECSVPEELLLNSTIEKANIK